MTSFVFTNRQLMLDHRVDLTPYVKVVDVRISVDASQAVAAFRRLGDSLAGFNLAMQIGADLFRKLSAFAFDETVSARRYAIERLDIAESDIRSVTADVWRHAYTVRLWNHRRITVTAAEVDAS